MSEMTDNAVGEECSPGWHGPWRSTANGWACVDCGAPDTSEPESGETAHDHEWRYFASASGVSNVIEKCDGCGDYRTLPRARPISGGEA